MIRNNIFQSKCVGGKNGPFHMCAGRLAQRLSECPERNVCPPEIEYICSIFFRRLSTFNQRGINMASSIRVQAALIDLSGTLHVEDTAIEGAQGALQR